MVLTTCRSMFKGPQGWCGEPMEECGQPPASHWLLPAIFPDLPLPKVGSLSAPQGSAADPLCPRCPEHLGDILPDQQGALRAPVSSFPLSFHKCGPKAGLLPPSDLPEGPTGASI